MLIFQGVLFGDDGVFDMDQQGGIRNSWIEMIKHRFPCDLWFPKQKDSSSFSFGKMSFVLKHGCGEQAF